MDHARIKYLLRQFASGSLSDEEQREFQQLLSLPGNESLVEEIAALMGQEGPGPSFTYSGEINAATYRSIMASDKSAQMPSIKSLRRIGWRWPVAAAAVLLFLCAGAWFFLKQPDAPIVHVQDLPGRMPEKEPGRNTAILTLADGSRIELDSLGNGVVATQGNSRVVLTNGQVAYTPQGNEGSLPVAFNTISTPRGGEFTIVLPDGSTVWLNAASSIKFPTSFTGDSREIELSGEAYLSVAEDKQHPFKVKIRNVNISVLGTQFNVMGYEDEAELVTTLVTGSVRIQSPGNAEKTIVPNQHAVVVNNTGALYVEKADVAEETAWKNGKTYFNNANICQIMRQVSRWYNVDVEFKGDVANMDFTCTVARKDKLSKLLRLLELTDAVHFTMEGNRIIVHP